MRLGVGVRFPSPDTLALVARTLARSRVGAGASGIVSLVGRASSRLTARPGLGSVPLVTGASFSIGTNPGFNALVGTVVATNNPTSFAIVSGNPSGFFSIASNGTLRTGASAAPPDNNYSLSVTATNSFGTSPPVTISVTVGAIPVVADQSFNLQLPTSNGAAVGDVVVTGGTPTSYAITAGNSAGYFAINSTGDITVTSAGASGITAQTYNLTVQATNALGNDNGVVSVVASSQAIIPLTYNDPIFVGMTNTANDTWISSGTMSFRSFPNDPVSEASIRCNNPGPILIHHCRADSNECIRFAGTSGGVTIEDSWFYAHDVDPAHADTMQCFGSGGDITIRRTYIKANNTAATAGFFCADGYDGTFTFENVIFDGGPYGLRVHSDGGPITLHLTNCYFLTGSFGTAPYTITETGSQITIGTWSNVRFATIVGGVIVPGSLISPPSL